MKRKQTIIFLFVMLIRQSIKNGRGIWISVSKPHVFIGYATPPHSKVVCEICGMDILIHRSDDIVEYCFMSDK